MDPSRWQHIEEIFHQAIELAGPSRSKFVETACKDSPEIQQEVISLLERHVDDSDFLERSPVSGYADIIQNAVESLATDISDSIHGSTIAPGATKHTDRINEQELRNLIESLGGQYEFRRVIGHGGMGTVAQVFDQLLKRDVALKIIARREMDDRALRSIIYESQAAAQVKSDHIVNIHTVAQNDATAFLVMELIEGPSLRSVIENQRQLDPAEAAEIARQIAVGLDDAHRSKLIHRDLKPANVLLEQAHRSSCHPYRAKIIDFGLAQSADDDLEFPGEGEFPGNRIAGTLAYMSPEQLFAPKKIDHRSDIYGLGATLYEMLTGEPPFRGASHRVIRQIESADPVPPRKLDDRLPRDLESICLKALNKDPGRRYQTAKEMVDDLQRFQNRQPTVARPLSAPVRAWRWSRRNSKVATFGTIATTALIALAIGSLWFAMTVDRKNRDITRHKSDVQEARIQTVIDAQPAALPLAIANLGTDELATSLLEEEFEKSQNDSSQRLNAALALSELGQPKTEAIISMTNEVFESPSMCANIVNTLRRDTAKATELIQRKLDQVAVADPENAKLQAKLLILDLHLTDFDQLPQIARQQSDPTIRTRIIHDYPNWHGDLKSLVAQLSTDRPSNWMVCQMLGLINPRSLRPAIRQFVSAELERIQQQTQYYSVFANSRWALRQWNHDPALPRIKHNSNPVSKLVDRDWRSVSMARIDDIDLVELQPVTMMLGRLDKTDRFGDYPSHQVTLTRAFAISSSEITVGQYRAFLNDSATAATEKPADADSWNPDPTASPTDHHPVQRVSWLDAVMFCNWLSRKEGLEPCYLRSDEDLEFETAKGDRRMIANWICDFDADGFRLPTEAEWEIACRAGSSTRFFFGNNPQFLDNYGLASNYRSMASSPFQQKMPNPFGLFNMHGNVWEWCNDWHSVLSGDEATDPRGPDASVDSGRVYRGGGIATLSGDTNSSSRGHAIPDTRYGNLGFRIARTIQ